MKRLERRPDASPNSTLLACSTRSFSGQKRLRRRHQALGTLPPAPPSCRVANQGLEPSAARAPAAPKRAPPAPRSASQPSLRSRSFAHLTTRSQCRSAPPMKRRNISPPKRRPCERSEPGPRSDAAQRPPRAPRPGALCCGTRLRGRCFSAEPLRCPLPPQRRHRRERSEPGASRAEALCRSACPAARPVRAQRAGGPGA